MFYNNPTDEQYDKILAHLPLQLTPPAKEDFAVLTFVATDNLINRSYSKWHLEELPKIAKMILGCPFTLDHDWGQIDKSQGICFDAKILKENSPDMTILDQCNNKSLNQQIVKTEGYVSVEVDVAFPSMSPVLNLLRYGASGCVSLGGFVFQDIWCPLCNTSFDDPDCPHFIPSPWEKKYKDTAPYYIRKSIIDLAELSLVLIPNYPNAKIK
jgi:hypothetical protein